MSACWNANLNVVQQSADDVRAQSLCGGRATTDDRRVQYRCIFSELQNCERRLLGRLEFSSAFRFSSGGWSGGVCLR